MLVLAISAVQQLRVDKVWVALKAWVPTSQLKRWLVLLVQRSTCIALLFLHSFSGCDTVSSFTEENCVEYIRRSHHSLQIPALLTINLRYWCFVVLLYDRTSTETKHKSTCSPRKDQKMALHQLKLNTCLSGKAQMLPNLSS
jgi:hypothetical protein